MFTKMRRLKLITVLASALLLLASFVSLAPAHKSFASPTSTAGSLAPLTSTGAEKISQPFTATYRITFAGDWTAADHQGAVSLPVGAHFSPLVGGVHKADVSFWAADQGALATLGIERMAELGLTAELINEVQAEINESPPDALATILRSGNITNLETVVIPSVTVTQDFPLITLVSMIAPSPDWFVGVSGLSMLEGAAWRDSVTVDLFPYDAGTEQGTEFKLGNPAEIPPQPIEAIAGEFPFNTNKLGTLTFTRIDYDAAIQISKKANVTEAAVGETITYTYRVTNTGDIPFESLAAMDNRLGEAPLGQSSLPPGQATGGVLTYTILETDLPGPLINTVIVTAGLPDASQITATAEASIGLEAATAVDPTSPTTQTVVTGGGEVVITIPPRALPAEAQTIQYMKRGRIPQTASRIGLPASAVFGLVYELNLLDAGGQIIENPTFEPPLTVSLTYDQTLVDTPGLDEESLHVFFYDDALERWEALAIIDRDPAQNRIAVRVDHLTEFALIGVSPRLYLPVVMK